MTHKYIYWLYLLQVKAQIRTSYILNKSRQAYERRSTTLLYICLFEYTVPIAASFLFRNPLCRLSIFVLRRKARAGASRGGGGALYPDREATLKRNSASQLDADGSCINPLWPLRNVLVIKSLSGRLGITPYSEYVLYIYPILVHPHSSEHTYTVNTHRSSGKTFFCCRAQGAVGGRCLFSTSLPGSCVLQWGPSPFFCWLYNIKTNTVRFAKWIGSFEFIG